MLLLSACRCVSDGPLATAYFLELRVCELPRIPILGTSVNRWGLTELRLFRNPLGRHPYFRARRHNAGIGIYPREHAAVRGDEQIGLVAIRGGGACAIRVDLIRAGEGLLTVNLPIKVD